MKTIYFSIALLFLVGCSEVLPEAPADPSEDDRSYNYSVSYSVTEEGRPEVISEGLVYAFSPSVDSAWTITLSSFYCSSASDLSSSFQAQGDGNFSFAFVYSSFGGYVDTISGSGFLSEDSLFLTYSYEELSSGNSGVVVVSSH